jgi:DNA (cytosine-5)-methyltransferase 1
MEFHQKIALDQGHRRKAGTRMKHIQQTLHFPSESPICGTDDGFPVNGRNYLFKWRNNIKGYGNAIVPQVALELFKVIQEIDNQLI